VQQHDRWRVLRASFAVEDADVVNCHTVIGRRGRNRFHRSSHAQHGQRLWRPQPPEEFEFSSLPRTLVKSALLMSVTLMQP
jgi:hypothetical protein